MGLKLIMGLDPPTDHLNDEEVDVNHVIRGRILTMAFYEIRAMQTFVSPNYSIQYVFIFLSFNCK